MKKLKVYAIINVAIQLDDVFMFSKFRNSFQSVSIQSLENCQCISYVSKTGYHNTVHKSGSPKIYAYLESKAKHG